MASVPGGQYSFFATGQAVNVVTTPFGLNVPPPIPGDFNLELITSLRDPPGMPPGYQGVALQSTDGKIIDLARGNYGLRSSRRTSHDHCGDRKRLDPGRQRP